jgi:hypothetical protein
MIKIKYPKINEDLIEDNSMVFIFSGGDLWKRDNVSKWDDLGECIDFIRKPLFKQSSKLDKFEWLINYYVPNIDQLKIMKENKVKNYEIVDDNLHTLMPLTYNFAYDQKMKAQPKNNTVYVSEDLLISEEDFIVEVINKLSNPKKIYFTMDVLSDGFLEEDLESEDYIKKGLKNDNWFDGHMTLDESYRDPEHGGKFLNDLDSLLYIKKNIDPSITFEFNYITDKEKEILKSQDLLS